MPGTGISTAAFWSGLADLVHDFGERNRQLLEVRDGLQSRVDVYHANRIGQALNLSESGRNSFAIAPPSATSSG